MNYYVGNQLQTRGVEQYVLQNGKGDGMHFLFVRNGLGLEAWISLDRAGDLSRVAYKGDNMGFFAPCGYVSPKYYDGVGFGFLKSFTGGFLTTCGLTAVGSPCVDDGETLPLHGTVSNTPAILKSIEENEDEITVRIEVTDASIFAKKLLLQRSYVFSYKDNSIVLNDRVINIGDSVSPYMILYHCNMGYPLLDETSRVVIPNNSFTPRNQHAAKYIETALKMEKPQAGFQERCYYYDLKEKNGRAHVGVFNDSISKGVVFEFNKTELPCFTEWKMMGKSDYVLGLEPGNCTPDGRDIVRKNGLLKELYPEETAITNLKFSFVDNSKDFEFLL